MGSDRELCTRRSSQSPLCCWSLEEVAPWPGWHMGTALDRSIWAWSDRGRCVSNRSCSRVSSRSSCRYRSLLARCYPCPWRTLRLCCAGSGPGGLCPVLPGSQEALVGLLLSDERYPAPPVLFRKFYECGVDGTLLAAWGLRWLDGCIYNRHQAVLY